MPSALRLNLDLSHYTLVYAMNAKRHQNWVSTDALRRPAPFTKRRCACKVTYAGLCGIAGTIILVAFFLLGLAVSRAISLPDVFEMLANPWSTAVHSPVHTCNFAEITTGAEVVMSLTSYSIAVERVPWYGQIFLSACSGRDFEGSRQLISAQLVFRQRDERDGTCWMFAGKHGTIAVILANPTISTSLVVHQPVSHQLTARTAAQAPRHIVLWGLMQSEENQIMPSDTSSHCGRDESALEMVVVDRFASSGHSKNLPPFIGRDTHLIKIGEFIRKSTLASG
ncbi:hypothetical protein BDZ89DRAFT_1142917 [Hymenopellis radicata]|nr:hypothetical protein BDZ89DRAFT_1142917 [Hymenopellis radicata]